MIGAVSTETVPSTPFSSHTFGEKCGLHYELWVVNIVEGNLAWLSGPSPSPCGS
jgi:hypothetical protein